MAVFRLLSCIECRGRTSLVTWASLKSGAAFKVTVTNELGSTRKQRASDSLGQ